MTNRIFRSTIFVAAVVLLLALSIAIGFLGSYFNNVQQRQLQAQLHLAAIGTQQQGLDYLQHIESDTFRLTWVASDGTVLYDTQADEGSMENHGDREEIREALQTGSGIGSRRSDTLTEKNVYVATLLSDGTVLRISTLSATEATFLLGLLQPVCVIIAIAIGLSAFLSHSMAKRIVGPLNRLDLDHPLENEAYEEITPLLKRINQQHLQISAHMQTLQRKTDEFRQITENLREAMILLDKDGLILSINPAAKRIFHTGDFCTGKNFLTIDPDGQLRNAINTAYTNNSSEIRIERDGCIYLLTVDRITSAGNTIGVAILVFDITQSAQAEQIRQEFSANVSHELKTPLQSIIGSAELLENGLVRQEDIPRFTGHIRREATRLVTLIEDIIRLSQLDEGEPVPMESADLLLLAQEAIEAVQSAAMQKNIQITLTGTACPMQGVRRMLYEIVYNLCDNAVKYNRDGGTVQVDVRATPEGTVLTVSDSGIGIPADQQPRIFERFFRVDKSHSRSSGGTGLGLSIVKHAAQYHKAKLSLESTLGKGTTITVSFP